MQFLLIDPVSWNSRPFASLYQKLHATPRSWNQYSKLCLTWSINSTDSHIKQLMENQSQLAEKNLRILIPLSSYEYYLQIPITANMTRLLGRLRKVSLSCLTTHSLCASLNWLIEDQNLNHSGLLLMSVSDTSNHSLWSVLSMHKGIPASVN